MANFGVCTQWAKTVDASHYLQLCSTLKHGDILEGKYPDNTETWAICTNISPQTLVVQCILGKDDDHWTVQKQTLYDLGFGGQLRINNSEDKLKRPKDVDDIIRTALEAVGHEGNGPFHPNATTVNVQRQFAECVRYTEHKDRLDKNNLSQWHWKDELPMFNWLLREGDIVQFRESKNIRWAICTDTGPKPMVVHREDGTEPGHWSVVKEALVDMVGDGLVRINNARDGVSKPKDVSDILRSAFEAVGKVYPSCVNPASDGLCQCGQSGGGHGSHFVESMRYSEQDINNRLNEYSLSKIYSKEELPVFTWLLRKGDIVQMPNTVIGNRYGICVEEPHIDQGRPSLVLPAFVLEDWSDQGQQPDTMVSCNFDVFRQDVKFRICNYYDNDESYRVRTVEDILKIANGEIGKTVSGEGNRIVTCTEFVLQARYNR